MKKLFIIACLPLLLVGCNQNQQEENDTSTVRGWYKNSTLSYKDIESGTSEIDTFFTTFANANHPYGEKFFINIEQDDCSKCWESCGPVNMASIKLKDDNQEFKLYTIFADEVDSNDNNLFLEYVAVRYATFFNTAISVYNNSYLGAYEEYRANTYIEIGDNYCTPTFYFVDFSFNAPAYTASNGISEVITNINHSDDIVDAYFHRGKYGAPN